MDKYEYMSLQFTSGDLKKLTDGLNKLGSEGWHVVSTTPCAYYQVQTGVVDGWHGIQYDILLERKIN